MGYTYLDINEARRFCEDIFKKRNFSEQESADIVDVLLTSDLYGIESHGIQRLMRYHLAIESGDVIGGVEPEIVFKTPMSVVLDAYKAMGHVVAKKGMDMAIDMAKKNGIGMVCVKRASHFGIAGYYSSMAAKADMVGICMANTEPIGIPTYGKKAMLGTNPIAICMPAEPTNFWYDVATTVVTHGKLEVYKKKGVPLPNGWAADENGKECNDADRVIRNIRERMGGGILPLGGGQEEMGSHKGYGLSVIVEMFTSIFAGGTTAPSVKNRGNANTSFALWAIDYGIFGDKKEIKERMSRYLQELRESPKADGHDRIYTHGEKEAESFAEKMKSGIPVNEKTLNEMKEIGEQFGIEFDDYFH